MYLTVVTVVLNSIIGYVLTDCGCQMNRNQEQCSNENDNPTLKYTKEANLIDNKLTSALDSANMVLIERHTFEMGSDLPVFKGDFEGPVRNVTVESFFIDKYEVSNQNFKNFVENTGYKTEAEIFGDSFIFEMVLPEAERKQFDDVKAVQAPWWIKMPGVTWEHPEGPNSSIEGK